ncbi:hypothetical protein [Rugamonas apoptosis]|nr:hypothetical protein [Rugamonas apoptosis]
MPTTAHRVSTSTSTRAPRALPLRLRVQSHLLLSLPIGCQAK